MRRKHLIFAVAFSLLIGSFIALVAVPQQQTLDDLVKAMNKADQALYHSGDPNSDPRYRPVRIRSIVMRLMFWSR